MKKFMVVALLLSGLYFGAPAQAAQVDVTDHQEVLEYPWKLAYPSPSGWTMATDVRIDQGNLACSGVFLSPSGKGYPTPIGIGSYFGVIITDAEFWSGSVAFLERGIAVESPVWFHDGCEVMPNTGDVTFIAGVNSVYGDVYSRGINVYSGIKKSTGGPLTKAGLTDRRTIRVVPDARSTIMGYPVPWFAGTQSDGPDDISSIDIVGKTLRVSFEGEAPLYNISFFDIRNPALGGMITRIA